MPQIIKDILPLKVPMLIWIDPTNMCNFKCVFCPTGDDELLRSVGRPKGMMNMKTYNKRTKKFIKYLRSNNYEIFPFDKSPFCLGVKRNNKDELTELKIFSLTRSRAFKKRPLDVVDFLNPSKEILKRNTLEAILFGTSYIYTPIPFLHTVIKILYKEAVIRRVHRYQMDEAAFKSHLRHNQTMIIKNFVRAGFTDEEAKSMYDKAYKQIERRELNPICPTKEEEIQLLMKRENWLQKKDSLYMPWRVSANQQTIPTTSG